MEKIRQIKSKIDKISGVVENMDSLRKGIIDTVKAAFNTYEMLDHSYSKEYAEEVTDKILNMFKTYLQYQDVGELKYKK